MVRVLLVDDHPFFRRGLRHLIGGDPGIDVVGEAPNGAEGVRLAAELEPDVVVMDLSMPVMGGVEATGRIADATPDTRVLVLTLDADEDSLLDALVAGAAGYLLKDAAPEDVIAGIRAAARGQSLVSGDLATRLALRLRELRPAREPGDLAALLSAREQEILRLVAQGRDNQAIADALFLSPKTVKNHVGRILEKLQVENRVQAAVLAVRSGLAD